MTMRRAAFLVVFTAFSLAIPRPAHADLFDFIWDMSGPQFFGAGFGCTFDTAGLRRCGLKGSGSAARQIKGDQERRRAQGLSAGRVHGPFFSLAGEVLVSTGKDGDDGTDYERWEAWRFALLPGVSFSTYKAGAMELFHGTGVTWDRLVGRDFKPFDKFGVTVTPVEAVLWDRLGLGFKIRMYPNSYTADEFERSPGLPRRTPVERLDYNRPFEAAYGFSITYLFDRPR